MNLSRKAILAVIATTFVVGLVVIVGAGIGIVKLWPVAWTWTQSALGGGDLAAVRRVVAQVGEQIGDDRIVQLSRTGESIAAFAAVAGKPGVTEILKLTAAIPALGPLLQNGAYQKALEEAVRQNVGSVAQIKIDQVTSPEVRALLLEVQQVVARNPQAAEAASVVNADVLNLLKSEAFAKLTTSPDFSRWLSASEPAKEAE